MDAIQRLHEKEVAALNDQCAAFRRAAEESDAYRQQRDELQAQLTECKAYKTKYDALQQQLDADRAAQQTTAHRALADQALRQALLDRGANPKAVPLLVKSIDLDALTLDDAGHPDEAMLSALCQEHADFFSQPKQLGLPVLEPPVGVHGPLSADRIRSMDAGEINANWPMIKAALSRP